MSTEPGSLIYCRALPLSRVREFPGWPAQASADERVVYLHEDLSVTTDPDPGSERLFVSDTPQWQQFCRGALEMLDRPPVVLEKHEEQPSESATAHG